MGDDNSAQRACRQPPEFKLNDEQLDFNTWFAQFDNFANGLKIKDADMFVTLIVRI